MTSNSRDFEGPDDYPHRIDNGSALGVNFALFRAAFRGKKRPRQSRGRRRNVSSERYFVRILLGAGRASLRLLGNAIQLANHIRANVPRGEFDARGLLAFADFALVLIAQQ